MIDVSRRTVLLGGTAVSVIRGLCPSSARAEDSDGLFLRCGGLVFLTSTKIGSVRHHGTIPLCAIAFSWAEHLSGLLILQDSP